MEQKNKTHPSLPSNYVTLAQLQERWLKQQNQIKQVAQQQQQQEEDKEEQQKQHQQQQEEEKHVAVVAPTNVTVSRSHPAEQYRRKNRNDSGTNNRRADEVASENRRKSEAGIREYRRKSEAGAAIGENRRKSDAVIGENRRKMETGAGIGDEKADLDGKVGESKKKNKKWSNKWKGKMKPKVEERGTIEEEGTAAQGNEVTEKTTTESELNDEKNVNTTKMEEVEQKIGGLSINPSNGKWKMKPKVKERGTIEEEEGAAAQGNEGAEKTTTESELNDEKSVNTTKVEEVEQKIGGLSINPRNDKQNWRVRRMNDGFRQFQSQRNYRAGSKQQQRSNVRSIWVRKDGGVGEIEP